MKKKTIVAAALASCLALSATFTGCSLVSTNNQKDMEQIIATVDISNSDKFVKSGLKDYENAIGETSIVKRELVSYFLNYGYSYIQNNNYTYEQTFNLLLDSLVDNAVLVQYTTLALLKDKVDKGATITSVVNEFTDTNKTEAQKYEYLLDEDEIKLAKYNFYSSINSAIDRYEKTLIDEDEEYKGTDTRTTPTNVNTENDDYYPKTEKGDLDYFIYTGYSNADNSYLLKDSGAYKDDAIEGTTRATRVKAYNTFLNNLESNYLIDREEEADKLTDVLALEYIQHEYVLQLQTRIINKYYDIYEEEMEAKLMGENGDYSYIQSLYDELLHNQTDNYKSAASFESAMGNMSSTSFILYSPSTSDSDIITGVDGSTFNGKFGFVYNILLPFSTKQNAKLTEIKAILDEDGEDDDYYLARNNLLKQIETEDQRAAWFNGETNYSFKADVNVDYGSEVAGYYGSDKGREYLFFEDNLINSGEGARYKKLQAYDGRYSYNGKVYENEDGSYTLIGNKLDIDGMLDEFSAYINYVLGSSGNVEVTPLKDKFYGTTTFSKKNDEGEDEIDYSLFLYAYGGVKLGGFNAGDLLNPETKQYKAMSAVNELQFAYTTDTSVLSQYVGYSVSAYNTSYIKEFEYACKFAIDKGEGSFAVCAGDYGWHLIYVTYTFDAGETYNPQWNKTNIETEGTFENLFYEWIKSSSIANISTQRRTKIISDFNKDATVTKYQKRYKDLLQLDN